MREFLYVDDAADAIIKSINYSGDLNRINIGTGNTVTIKKLSNTIKKIMKFNGKILWNKKTESGIFKKNFNISLAKNKLKFSHKVNLEKGLIKTINWYNETNKTSI